MTVRDAVPIDASLTTELPDRLAVGDGTALVLEGTCGADGRYVKILADGRQTVHNGVARGRSAGTLGWWGIVPVAAVDAPREARFELACEGGLTKLRSLRLERRATPASSATAAVDSTLAQMPAESGPLIVICLATHEPDPRLLRRQLDSIRSQSHRNWLCIVGDDCSSEGARSEIVAAIADDPRFVLVPAASRLGVYVNYERLLELVPAAAELVALCDQDDAWHPDKLEALIEALAAADGAALAYSDMRVVDREGGEISSTYWTHRPNNHTDFGSLLIANTVTGAATLIRRSLLERALPFPPEHGRALHDHWLAVVALAAGPIAYVDRPLLDYTQHRGAALGHRRANADGRYGGSRLERVRAWLRLARRPSRALSWRRAYFDVYCRLVQMVTVVGMRFGDELDPEHRRPLEALGNPPRAARWLAGRTLPGRGSAATLGREQVLLAGLAWRAASALSVHMLRRR